MDKNAILEIAHRDPNFSRAVDEMQAKLSQMNVMPEDIQQMVGMLEAVLQDPSKYAEVRQAAIADRMLDPSQAPEQFDPVFVASVLAALYELLDRMQGAPQGMPQGAMQEGFARGGLAQAARQLQAAGRGGDSMLAHINPKEAEVLRRMGGSGTVNPNTGLREYKSGGGLLGVILPIALNFIVPGAGAILGKALGASAMFAPALGGALIGGASAALTGGDPLKGALMGGLGGGLGGMAGSAANKAFGLNLGTTGQGILGSGLIGGVAGAATGQGFLQGATQGALGQLIGGKISGMGGSGFQAGGQDFANMMAAGYDPKTAAITGGLSGLAASMQSALKGPQQAGGTGLKPSDAVVEGLKGVDKYAVSDLTPQGGVNYGLTNTGTAPSIPEGVAFNTNYGNAANLTAPPGALMPQSGGGFNLKDVGSLLPLASMIGGAPAPVQTAIQKMSPQQQEYFNRPSIKWDWNKLQQDAAMSGMDLTNYMAQNWPQIQSGVYNTPVEMKARGGPLHVMANFARGAGSGRADTIDAKLSDGEYVMDAETVALLGDGSSKEGANRLDMMRESLRAHKGKSLSKGKFSPNAKSPLAYLKGAA